MLKLTVIAVAVLSLGLPVASYSEVPTATLVLRTVVQPVGLKRGDPLQPGTPIKTGADGLVVYTESWKSHIDGYDCVAFTVVGYGTSAEVVSRATPGRCERRAVAPPRPGQPQLSSGTRLRYADGPADDPRRTPPEVIAEVMAANQEWREFDDWMRNARTNGNTRHGGMGPLVPGLVYRQGDYRSELVGSAEACSALCAQEAQCHAMTFIISQGRCWLKNTVPPTAESADMISAAKEQ